MSIKLLILVIGAVFIATLLVISRRIGRRSTARRYQAGNSRDSDFVAAEMTLESAASLIARHLRQFPLHVIELQGKQDILWNRAYIEDHPTAPRVRERFEVRQIGRELLARGGTALMHHVALRAGDRGVGGVGWTAHHLEYLWKDIGNWAPEPSPKARVEVKSSAEAMQAFEQLISTLSSISTSAIVAAYGDLVHTWRGPAMTTVESFPHAVEAIKSNLQHDEIDHNCATFVLTISSALTHIQVDSINSSSGQTFSHRMWRNRDTFALFSSDVDAIAPHLPGSDSADTSTVFAAGAGPAWQLTTWDIPDLSVVKQYGLARKQEWEPYVPKLTLVPCGGEFKPAIFIKVVHSEFSDWNTTVEPHAIDWQYFVTPPPTPYVLLGLTVQFRNQNKQRIGGPHPSGLAAVGDIAAHRLECRAWLDPSDPDVEEAVRRWATWPTPTVFFILDDEQPYSGYLTVTLRPEQRAVAITRFTEALSELQKDPALPANGFEAAYRMVRRATPPTSNW